MLTADDITAAVSYADAVDDLDRALRQDVDPAADPARTAVDVAAGHLLLMPASSAGYAGVKVASVAPDNPAKGLPRIQAVYVLFDADTLAPIAWLDGTALTSLRTPAVSAVAARYLTPERVEHLVLFGSGPQAYGHLDAVAAIREIGSVTVVGRNRERAQELADYAQDKGLRGAVGQHEDVRDADLIVCATTASTPLFDGSLVADRACVLAIGSHETDCRELDSALMGRSTVVVEDRAAALREAGDVVLAIADGTLDEESLIPLRDLVREAPSLDDRPRVFKGTGMSWQDLVVASSAYRHRKQ